MPLFLNHRLLFIHIPKCGGDTISHALRQAGDPPFLFVDNGAVMANGHTPQHLTWRELKAMGWTRPEGFRVAALVRHPVDRVLSEFRYLYRFRKDLLRFAETSGQFLDHFLSADEEAARRFDNHNKGLLAYLTNQDGSLDPSIYIEPLSRVNVWLEKLSLPSIPASERRNVTSCRSAAASEFVFSSEEIERIRDFYRDDVRWYEQRFSEVKTMDKTDGL